MNLKEFLRPTANKIALFIFILILLPMPVYMETVVEWSSNGGESGWTIVPFAFFMSFGSAMSYCVGGNCGIDFSTISWTTLISSIVISYFLSCLVVWGYNKWKSKGKVMVR